MAFIKPFIIYLLCFFFFLSAVVQGDNNDDVTEPCSDFPFRFDWFSGSYSLNGTLQNTVLLEDGTLVGVTVTSISLLVDAQNKRIRYDGNLAVLGNYYLLSENQTYVLTELGPLTTAASPLFLGSVGPVNGVWCTRLAWSGQRQRDEYFAGIINQQQAVHVGGVKTCNYFGRSYDVGTDLSQKLASSFNVDKKQRTRSWQYAQYWPNLGGETGTSIQVVGSFLFPQAKDGVPDPSYFEVPSLCAPLFDENTP